MRCVKSVTAFLLVLFVGVSVGAEPKPLSPDLAAVPSSAGFLVALNIGEHWNGPEAESLRQTGNVHPVFPTFWLKGLEKATGVRPEDLARLMVVGVPTGQSVFFIATRKPYDKSKVVHALAPEGVETTLDGKVVVQNKKNASGVCLLNAKTFAIGSQADLEACLKKPVDQARPPQMQRLLETVDQGAIFTSAVMSEAILSHFGKVAPEHPLAPLWKANAWEVVAKADKGLTVTLVADFANNEAAAAGKAAMEKLCEQLAQIISLGEEKMPPFLEGQEAKFPGSKAMVPKMKAALTAAGEAIAKKKVEVRGARLEATFAVKTDQPATTFALLITLMPRPGR